jgi:hypothetical protein
VCGYAAPTTPCDSHTIEYHAIDCRVISPSGAAATTYISARRSSRSPTRNARVRAALTYTFVFVVPAPAYPTQVSMSRSNIELLLA